MRRTSLTAFAAGAALLVLTGGLTAYSTYAKWADGAATFYVNPANADNALQAGRTDADIVNALWAGMDAWNTQSGTSFRFNYGGQSSDTATALDYRNVIFFRNASSGGAIASTYSWWNSSNQLLDSDIIFWDSGFSFYTGSTGCGTTPANPTTQTVGNSAYVEDVATHELGHALGLNHSGDPAATMYPSYSYCSQEMRSLGADDIAGARSLYGNGSPQPLFCAIAHVVQSVEQRQLRGRFVDHLHGVGADAIDGVADRRDPVDGQRHRHRHRRFVRANAARRHALHRGLGAGQRRPAGVALGHGYRGVHDLWRYRWHARVARLVVAVPARRHAVVRSRTEGLSCTQKGPAYAGPFSLRSSFLALYPPRFFRSADAADRFGFSRRALPSESLARCGWPALTCASASL